MPELLPFCALRCSHSRVFCALRCCLLLLQLCLLFNHLRSPAFSPFSTGFCHFFLFHTSLSPIFHISLLPLFFINSCAFSYCLSFLFPDEASGRSVVHSTVCCCTVFCSLDYYTSILFVLHKFRNFFSVAHFGAAILVFSELFGAASCCCNFAFCSTTYARPLSHLSLLAFVTFVFFTLRCHLFFILRYNLSSSSTHALSHSVFHFSYLMKLQGEAWLILLSVGVPSFAFELIIRQYFSSYLNA